MRELIRSLPFIVCVVLAAQGQEDRTQMTSGAQRDTDPMISPDGNALAFASDRTGHFNLYIFSYKTTGILQLTHGNSDDRYPNWSQDSKKIVFCSDRTGKGDIYQTDADGSSGFLQLTDLEWYEEYPSYAPRRGGGLLFARAEKKGLVRRQMNVVYSDSLPAASNAVILADGDEPRFSPDGSRIVFTSRRTKNNDVWVMDRNGSGQTQLTMNEKDDETPSFSPDGRYIVFASRRTGNFDIWVMDADGGNQRQLTYDPADEKQPCWSVGGYIYYTHEFNETHSNIFRIKAPR